MKKKLKYEYFLGFILTVSLTTGAFAIYNGSCTEKPLLPDNDESDTMGLTDDNSDSQ